MTLAIRTILILTLMCATAAGAMAQPEERAEPARDTAAAGTTPETSEAEPPAPNSQTLRDQTTALIGQYPPEVGSLLWLDPTLLADEPFLARYPDLARFVAEHPEIRHHPRYYLADLPSARTPARREHPMAEVLEPLLIILVFSLLALGLGWFVRMVLDYRRMNRLERAQAEVHNRIMDRLGSSDELLQYMRTPAGSKYLELTPIRLQAQSPRPPVTRSLWSIQIGVIVGFAALGLLFLSGNFAGETAQGFLAMGTIGVAVGLGFIASAAVSIFLSRRLGLWEAAKGADLPSAERLEVAELEK